MIILIEYKEKCSYVTHLVCKNGTKTITETENVYIASTLIERAEKRNALDMRMFGMRVLAGIPLFYLYTLACNEDFA